jgi:outer membrane protein OmpA-like peptidoglycan-associated protein
MKTVLYCLLASLLAQAALAEDCPSLDSRLKQQVQDSQMDAAEATLRQMGAACPQNIAGEDEAYFTDTLASQANDLAAQGQLDSAEALLKKARRASWMVSSVRGYIASQRKPTDWGEVAKHYNYALELLTDPENPALKNVPDLAAAQQRILALATEAQLLYGKPTAATRGGQPHGILLAAARGIGAESIQLPVHFDTNSDKLDDDGRLSADTLAEFLLWQKPAAITLIGHADPRGGADYNLALSKQRAETLAKYLKKKGVTAKIATDGKGESERPILSDLQPTEQELWQRWRRVELKLGN